MISCLLLNYLCPAIPFSTKWVFIQKIVIVIQVDMHFKDKFATVTCVIVHFLLEPFLFTACTFVVVVIIIIIIINVLLYFLRKINTVLCNT